jgi:hypothetical protein
MKNAAKCMVFMWGVPVRLIVMGRSTISMEGRRGGVYATGGIMLVGKIAMFAFVQHFHSSISNALIEENLRRGNYCPQC